MVKGKGVRKRRCLRSPIQVPRSGGNYDPCPEGDANAVCVDIYDLGMVRSEKYDKTQAKVMFCWQTEHLDERGLPFLVFKTYTNSLHEKASLRRDLQKWLKADFKLEALQKDLELVLGKGARLEIVHNENGGKTYANVDGIRPLAAGQKAPAQHPDFTRKKDRKGDQKGPFGKHGKASDPDEGPQDENF